MLILQTSLSTYICWPVVRITWCMGWFVDVQLRYNLTWFACSLPDKTKFGRNFEKLNTFYFLALQSNIHGKWLFIWKRGGSLQEKENKVRKKASQVTQFGKNYFLIHCLLLDFFRPFNLSLLSFFDVYLMVDIIVFFLFLILLRMCIFGEKFYIM